ncbi:MAG: hypothetical protein IKN64_11885 [Desulfovibrio sp.]|nr:hypothetical protein [Desulfovibrio sp.]
MENIVCMGALGNKPYYHSIHADLGSYDGGLSLEDIGKRANILPARQSKNVALPRTAEDRLLAWEHGEEKPSFAQ